MIYDYLIIGGGIVGASTAWQLKQRHPDKSVLLVEKESVYAKHQTGHNSGVIHAGVYYAPGSLKAKFCKEGVQATIKFCDENGIKYDQCGKFGTWVAPTFGKADHAAQHMPDVAPEINHYSP